MRLWTVQPVAVWETLRSAGRIEVDRYRVHPDGWVYEQYRWIARQLRGRIPGSRGRLPWWAYCNRPDLRWVRHTHAIGSRHVRIELEAPEGSYLSFPTWAWHCVFCRDHLSLSREESRDWLHRLKAAGLYSPDRLEEEVRTSWLRLFRPNLPDRSWNRKNPFRGREAVLPVLKHEWVRKVAEFVGTNRLIAAAMENRARKRSTKPLP